MGYEINFIYHEEISKGEYNREETKIKNIKVGSPYEDIPLEAVAGRIMSQLARRNVLIVDVEIFEYTKKKLSYKETEDGILIKHKKFSFDDGVGLTCVDVPEETSSPPVAQPAQSISNEQIQALLSAILAGNNNNLTNLMAGNQNLISDIVKGKPPNAINLAPPPKFKVIRHEIFNPIDKLMIEDVKRRGMSFTLGKKYPILNERMAPNLQAGMMYTTLDDHNNRQILSDKFFTPDIGRLENDAADDSFVDQFKPQAASGGGTKIGGDGLSWDGVLDDSAPSIRR